MMLRLSLALAAACMLSASLGCTLCCAPFDTAFGAYGGAIERHDQYHGRVGSVFDPAGAQIASYEQMADEAIVEPDTPFESVDPETDFEPIDPGVYE